MFAFSFELISNLCLIYKQTETRKAELETNLSTNLKRRIDELHATIASVDDYSLPSSAGLETQELDDAKLLVEEFTNELQGEPQTLLSTLLDIFLSFVYYLG